MAKSWDFGRGRAGFVWRAAAPRARVLLQHGYGEYAGRYVARYAGLIPALNAAGFDVYAFDFEGHGETGGAPGVADIKIAVEDHLAARDALTLDGAPLFLFGHSLGGLVTAASVAREQRGVAGVVLSAPALLIELSPVLKLIANLLGGIAPAARLTPPIAPESLSRIPEEVAAYRADPMICLLPPPAKLGATALAVSEDGWRRYGDWQVPVLVVHGAKDAATPAKGSERFCAMVGAADKRMEIYPEGYHELLNDIGREEVLALVLGWLSDRAPR